MHWKEQWRWEQLPTRTYSFCLPNASDITFLVRRILSLTSVVSAGIEECTIFMDFLAKTKGASSIQSDVQ